MIPIGFAKLPAIPGRQPIRNRPKCLRWYEQTPQALDGVRAMVLEEQVVEWVLERARVSEKPSTFAEIMTRPAKQARIPQGPDPPHS
ncbi:MAG: hypothetical protein U5O69_08310 [Candidatus Competibacteraceae bacterium]|nr:hypothetical protein [Candidatus Competibacteraceae bacterium]